MNFEMAQELAEMEGINVQTVIVRDDIAVTNEAQRRGVAGTVFVHKLAGYLLKRLFINRDKIACRSVVT